MARRRRSQHAKTTASSSSSNGANAANEPDDPVSQNPAFKPARPDGPWDLTELADPYAGRVDLGGLLVPGFEGMELRVEFAEERVVAVTCVSGESAIQLQAFAAARSIGIWDDVRAELAANVTQQGGVVDTVSGPLGTELRAQVTIQLPDGTSGAQLVRFVGCDGPRWFLRGVASGQAAVDPATAGPLEQVFRDVVVVRGAEPMAPREAIPLRLPAGAQAASETAGTVEAFHSPPVP